MSDSWFTYVSIAIVTAILLGGCILDLCHNRPPPNKYPYKFILVRFANWLTVGLTYAFTYFGRYNMTQVNSSECHDFLGLTKTQFGSITTVRTLVYAVCVVINGFIVDRFPFLYIMFF